MVKIQIDMDKASNKKVEIHKAKKGFIKKSDALLDMIKTYKES